MFDRILRRRRANVIKPATTVVPWDRHATVFHTSDLLHERTERVNQADEAVLSPSNCPPTTPTTSFTPDDLHVLSPGEETFMTNGEYYNQFLIRKDTRFPKRAVPAPSPDSNGDSTSLHPLPPRNITTLRGMPLPKRNSVVATTLEVDTSSPLLSEESSPDTTVPLQVFGMMAPRPTPLVKKKLNKPKSLNLKSSAFRTLSKATHQGPHSSSSSMVWGPKPSPSTSTASMTPNNTKEFGKSPLVSGPEFGSKWRSDHFKDLIPQLVGPQTSVPWRSNSINKRSHRRFPAASRYKDRTRRLFTSGLGSMHDDHIPVDTPSSSVMHISPPIMTNMSAEDSIPSAFLTAGSGGTNIVSPRHSYYQSLPSGSSMASNVSMVSDSSRLTQLVVKKNPSFDVPVSSGKSLLFN